LSLKTVHNAYLALEAEAGKNGLKINEKKTKYMLAFGNKTIFTAGQTVALGNMNFKVIDELVNL
jgi:hypothetical protein